MSRSSVEKRPSCGTPSAVWNTSFPTSSACSNDPGGGGVAVARSRVRTVFAPRSSTETEKPMSFATYARLPSSETATPIGRLPVWKRTTPSGAPMEIVPSAARAARST